MAMHFILVEQPIPWMRDHFNQQSTLPPELPHYRHIGLYGYRASFLKHYAELSPCLLEREESLEQLRALHYGKENPHVKSHNRAKPRVLILLKT